jgi:hypothetical protein
MLYMKTKEVSKMKSISEKMERIFTAAAYAEAGEYDVAKVILREKERPPKQYRISPTQRPRKVLRAPGMDR